MQRWSLYPRSAAFGAAYMFALGVAASVWRPEEYKLPARLARIGPLAMAHYKGRVIADIATLIVVSLCAGALLWLVAAAIFRALRRRAPTPWPAWRDNLVVFALALTIHALLLAWSARTRPGPFAMRWHSGASGRLLFDTVALGASPSARPVATWAPAPPNTEAIPRKPDIVLVVVDSLRFDSITEEKAPNLFAASKVATVFNHAYTVAPRTLSAWSTMLTGRYPAEHGIRQMFPRYTLAHLSGALPNVLKARGYRTAVVSDAAGDIFSLLGDVAWDIKRVPGDDLGAKLSMEVIRGQTQLVPLVDTTFGRWLFPEVRQSIYFSDPDRLASETIAALESLPNAPTFAAVFFSSVHFPFIASGAEIRARVAAESRADDRRSLVASRDTLTGLSTPPPADVAHMRCLYDAAAASVDDAIGDLLRAITKSGRDTVVIVLSDHGEHLADHGRSGFHGEHLFGDEALHIPLLVIDPRRPPRRVDTLASNVDVAATILDIAGSDRVPEIGGRSLLADAPPRDMVFAESEVRIFGEPKYTAFDVDPTDRIYAQSLGDMLELEEGPERWRMVYGDPVAEIEGKQRMVKDDRYKLVYVPTRKGPRYHLFDTVADAAETNDIAPAHPEVVERLRARLIEWMLLDPNAELRDGIVRVKAGVNPPTESKH